MPQSFIDQIVLFKNSDILLKDNFLNLSKDYFKRLEASLGEPEVLNQLLPVRNADGMPLLSVYAVDHFDEFKVFLEHILKDQQKNRLIIDYIFNSEFLSAESVLYWIFLYNNNASIECQQIVMRLDKNQDVLLEKIEESYKPLNMNDITKDMSKFIELLVKYQNDNKFVFLSNHYELDNGMTPIEFLCFHQDNKEIYFGLLKQNILETHKNKKLIDLLFSKKNKEEVLAIENLMHKDIEKYSEILLESAKFFASNQEYGFNFFKNVIDIKNSSQQPIISHLIFTETETFIDLIKKLEPFPEALNLIFSDSYYLSQKQITILDWLAETNPNLYREILIFYKDNLSIYELIINSTSGFYFARSDIDAFVEMLLKGSFDEKFVSLLLSTEGSYYEVELTAVSLIANYSTEKYLDLLKHFQSNKVILDILLMENNNGFAYFAHENQDKFVSFIEEILSNPQKNKCLIDTVFNINNLTCMMALCSISLKSPEKYIEFLRKYQSFYNVTQALLGATHQYSASAIELFCLNNTESYFNLISDLTLHSEFNQGLFKVFFDDQNISCMSSLFYLAQDQLEFYISLLKREIDKKNGDIKVINGLLSAKSQNNHSALCHVAKNYPEFYHLLIQHFLKNKDILDIILDSKNYSSPSSLDIFVSKESALFISFIENILESQDVDFDTLDSIFNLQSPIILNFFKDNFLKGLSLPKYLIKNNIDFYLNLVYKYKNNFNVLQELLYSSNQSVISPISYLSQTRPNLYIDLILNELNCTNINREFVNYLLDSDNQNNTAAICYLASSAPNQFTRLLKHALSDTNILHFERHLLKLLLLSKQGKSIPYKETLKDNKPLCDILDKIHNTLFVQRFEPSEKVLTELCKDALNKLEEQEFDLDSAPKKRSSFKL